MEANEKPNLLMLTYGVPDAFGNDLARRSWQMLQAARQSHQVHLACIVDGRVNMREWRRVSAQATRVMIESVDASSRIAAACLSLRDTAAAHQRLLHSATRRAIDAWRHTTAFDVVFCGHPAMAAAAKQVPAALHACDITSPGGMSAWRGQLQRQSRSLMKLEAQAARLARLIIVDRPEKQMQFITSPCEVAVVTAGSNVNPFNALHEITPIATQAQDVPGMAKAA